MGDKVVNGCGCVKEKDKKFAPNAGEDWKLLNERTL